jgi:hypothetical protein
MKSKQLNWLGTLLLFVIGLVNSYLSTQKYGIGLISDSYAYLKMAENFADSGQFICYEGYAFTIWPPLYPMLLAVPIFFGMESLQAALLLNMLAYGLSLCLAYHCLLPFAVNKLLRIALFLLVIGFYPLYSEANFAMTDMLFFCCCLLFARSSQNYEGTFKSLSGLALAVAAAWLLRYVGVVLCVAGVFVIFLYHTKTLKDKLLATCYYLFVSTMPMIFWLIYNYFTNGHLYGQRTWGNGYQTIENIQLITSYLSFQLLPFQLPVFLQNLGLLSLLVILAYFSYTQKSILHPKAKRLLVVYLLFSIIYWLFLLILSASAAFVPMYLRYLAPTSYLILILFFAFWVHFLHFIAKKVPKTAQKWCYFIAALATSVWIFQHLRSTALQIAARNEWGAGGFTTKGFMQTNFQLWLNKQKFEGIIFTNALHLAYKYLLYAKLNKTEARLLLDTNKNFTTDFVNKKGKKIALFFHNAEVNQKFEKNIPYKLLYEDEGVSVYEF